VREFAIQPNKYLNQGILGFYHTDYTRHGNPGNPDYLNTLKNTFADAKKTTLDSAVRDLENVLCEDLPQIFHLLQVSPVTVCVVPRAKAESSYKASQLLFKSAVRSVVKQLNGFCDGIDYIRRHSDTKTTHLNEAATRRIKNNRPDFRNEGAEPYPGITAETCHISKDVSGKNILLIDDIYTKTINIDEDAIQVLLNHGACAVVFYAIGRTLLKEDGR